MLSVLPDRLTRSRICIKIPYMGLSREHAPSLDDRIGRRLRQLRGDQGWSLDVLAARSGVSRATLSRLENAEVSATAAVLGKLSAALGLTLSRLMHLVEDDYTPVLRRTDQPVWTDPETGFCRRVVSPPAQSLAAEVLEARLPPNTHLAYPGPPRPGLEHHLVVLDGAVTVTVGAVPHALAVGDCLRYRLFGPSAFDTGPDCGVRYLLVMV